MWKLPMILAALQSTTAKCNLKHAVSALKFVKQTKSRLVTKFASQSLSIAIITMTTELATFVKMATKFRQTPLSFAWPKLITVTNNFRTATARHASSITSQSMKVKIKSIGVSRKSISVQPKTRRMGNASHATIISHLLPIKTHVCRILTIVWSMSSPSGDVINARKVS